jgi:hypothetical protein
MALDTAEIMSRRTSLVMCDNRPTMINSALSPPPTPALSIERRPMAFDSLVSLGMRRASLCALAIFFLAALPTASQADESADGFNRIFNGQNLEGWDANPKFWRVEAGVIVGQTTPENPTATNTFCIWQAGNLEDFVLRAKFKIDGGNSGIQYRSKDNGNWSVSGYQADFDAATVWTGSLYEERGRGVLAKRGNRVVIKEDGKKEPTEIAKESDIVANIKKDDWNEYEISAVGNVLTHKLNGMTTIEVVDEQASARAMSGILALQVHAGPPMKVEFKDIQLKRLPVAESGK